MKHIFFQLIITLLISTVCFANQIDLSLSLCFNSLALEAVNNSGFDKIFPFKRGVTTIFLISTESGQIFENKYWQYQPVNSTTKSVKSLPINREKTPLALSLTPQDLSHYLPLKNGSHPTSFHHLFVKALIKSPCEKADSFISTSINELIIKDKRISEVKEVSDTMVPTEVKVAFEMEIEKITAEENSPE